MSTYQGTPGGPRDPNTPGGYCLTICRCGDCPQYPEQARRAEQLRDAEYQARLRKEGEQYARRDRRMRGAA